MKPIAQNRRKLYREAKRAVYRVTRAAWHGTRIELRRAIRGYLAGKSRRFLGRILALSNRAGGAAALTLALASAAATPSYAQQHVLDLADVVLDDNKRGYLLTSPGAGTRFGYSSSNAGDINGDGLADQIVGAPDEGVGDFNRAGRGHVFFGKRDGVSAVPTFVIEGGESYDYAGYSVSGGGDINGDGLADLILGAPGEDSNGSSSGAAFVVFGKADTANVALNAIRSDTDTGGFIIKGAASVDAVGTAVCNAGDVNGDGFDDILVSAIGESPNGIGEAGAAYVVFGKADGIGVELSAIRSNTNDGGFAINGENINDVLGLSLCGAGDVNGDGLDDMIVGSTFIDPNGDQSGKAYVVFGKEDGASIDLSDLSMDANDSGFAILGEAIYDAAAQGLSTAGDVNRDGLADVIVGAWGSEYQGSNTGRAYVIFGKADGTTVALSDISKSNDPGGFAINGNTPGHWVGQGVGTARDYNGDGLSDLWVGAGGADIKGQDSGRVFVVYGKGNGAPVDVADIEYDGSGGIVIDAESELNYLGYGPVFGGDVNFDGKPDLTFSTAYGQTDSVNTGRAYVVFNDVIMDDKATYYARSRAGDGIGGAVVPPTVLPDARFSIDFPDDDESSGPARSASLETVRLFRSLDVTTDVLPGFALVALDAVWRVTTERTGWGEATIALTYTDAEGETIEGAEDAVSIYTAPTINGPWTAQETVADAARHRLETTLPAFTSPLFVIAGMDRKVVWAQFKSTNREYGTESFPFDTLQEAAAKLKQRGTVKIKRNQSGDKFSPESITITKAMRIEAVGGPVVIGTE